MKSYMDGMIPPKDSLITYETEVVKEIRKLYNLDKNEDRDKAIAIIHEWVQKQEHFVKKDYSNGYIERCIVLSKGSIQRAKLQIDKMCTYRTLLPQYFQITNLKESGIMGVMKKAYFSILPKLTNDHCRVVLLKIKPNEVAASTDYTMFYNFLTIASEYFQENDYCQGYVLVVDFYDARIQDVVGKLNLVELQQFIPVLTGGYGGRVKGIYLVTASKLIENFIKILKPVFSKKIRSRIHAVTTKHLVQDYIPGAIFPKEYGGTERPVEVFHEKLIETFSSLPVQKLLAEMNQAVTDESKRPRYKYYEQYMGMPGTFRTLSID